MSTLAGIGIIAVIVVFVVIGSTVKNCKNCGGHEYRHSQSENYCKNCGSPMPTVGDDINGCMAVVWVIGVVVALIYVIIHYLIFGE